PASLPAWLHRTACNLAFTALRTRKRRERVEADAVKRTSGSPLDELSSRELLAILDDELHRLPEVLRLPLILCCLEGRSQDEVAIMLGWTPGSVRGRLERGRQRLKSRLMRRGLTFAVGAGVPLLVAAPTLGGLLREATIRAACAGGNASPTVAQLADAVTKPLLLASWKAIIVGLAFGIVGAGLPFAWLWRSPEQPAAAETLPSFAVAENQSPVPFTDRYGESLPEGAVARFGSARLRIGNSAFALTPDGEVIVAVAPEGIVRKF